MQHGFRSIMEALFENFSAHLPINIDPDASFGSAGQAASTS